MQLAFEPGIGEKAQSIFKEEGFSLIPHDSPDAKGAKALLRDGKQLIGEDFRDRFPELEVIGAFSTDAFQDDAEVLTRLGITLLQPQRLETHSAADFVLWQILESYRKRRAQASELRGKTIGFLGFTPLAEEIARRLHGFEVELLAYDPDVRPGRLQGFGCQFTPWAELMIAADIVCVTLPLSKTSRGFITRDTIRLMKDDALLIHMTEPDVLDREDLKLALELDYVSQLIIDLPDRERAFAQELAKYPVVTVTINEAANTQEAYLANVRDIAQDMKLTLQGEIADTAINVPRTLRPSPETQAWLHLACLLGEFMGRRLSRLPRQASMICYGYALEAGDHVLQASFLEGLAFGLGQVGINKINSQLWAQENGFSLKFQEEKDPAFSGLELVFQTVHGLLQVAGHLTHDGPVITAVDGYQFLANPTPHVLLVPHPNRPGMVGKVGTLLGEQGVNIGGMVLGHQVENKGKALMWIVLDEDPTQEVLEDLRAVAYINKTEYIHLSKSKEKRGY